MGRLSTTARTAALAAALTLLAVSTLTAVTFWMLSSVATNERAPVPPLIISTAELCAKMGAPFVQDARPEALDAWLREVPSTFSTVLASTMILDTSLRPSARLERAPAAPNGCTSALVDSGTTRSCRAGAGAWLASRISDERWLVVEFTPMGDASLLTTHWAGLWLVTVVPVLALTVPMGLGVGLLLTRRQRRRLERIVSAASSWALGRNWTRLADPTHDDLGLVARTLDDLGERLTQALDTQAQLSATEARRHLAAELHDHAKQNVFAASVLVGAMMPKVGDARPIAEKVQHALKAALSDIEVVMEQPAGGTALTHHALVTTGEQVSRLWSLPVPTQGPAFEVVAPVHEVTSIVREALINAAKHATGLSLRWNLDDEALRVDVSDAGPGFDSASSTKGRGLETMATRAKSLGARLIVDSTNQGTTVRLEVPRRRRS